MEGLSEGLSIRFGTFNVHHLLLCDRTMRPNLSCVETNLCVAEDVALKHEMSLQFDHADVRTYREDIDEAHDDDNDARSNDNPPEC